MLWKLPLGTSQVWQRSSSGSAECCTGSWGDRDAVTLRNPTVLFLFAPHVRAKTTEQRRKRLRHLIQKHTALCTVLVLFPNNSERLLAKCTRGVAQIYICAFIQPLSLTDIHVCRYFWICTSITAIYLYVEIFYGT